MRNALLVISIILVGVSGNFGLLNTKSESQVAQPDSPAQEGTSERREKKSPNGPKGGPEVDNDPIMKLYEVDDANSAYYEDGVLADLCKNSKSSHSTGPGYCMTPLPKDG
jgi:hypothetical protein